MTASRLAIRALDWASGAARWPSMNFWLLPSAVASPWQTVESAADSVLAFCVVDCDAFDVVARAKAPPCGDRGGGDQQRELLLGAGGSPARHARLLWGRGAYAAMYGGPNDVTHWTQESHK